MQHRRRSTSHTHTVVHTITRNNKKEKKKKKKPSVLPYYSRSSINKKTMMRKCLLPLILSLSLIATSARISSAVRMVGGRIEIKNVKSNEEVQELGRFSVRQYSNNIKNANDLRLSSKNDGSVTELKFVEVVKAERQVVSGIKYYLTVQAKENGVGQTRLYEAQVVVQPWLHQSKTLLKFSPSTAT